MGLETAIGLGISGISGILGGASQERAGNRARQDQLARMAMIDRLAQGQMTTGPSPWEGRVEDLLGRMGRPGNQFDPFQNRRVNAAMVGDFGIDLQQLFNQPTYNAGQDALMQVLRADPTQQMQATNEFLLGTQASGNAFNTSDLFGALGRQDQRAQQEALAALNAQAGSLGARFGSANQAQSRNLLSQMAENAATRNAGIAMQSHEAAQGRRMGAAQQLAGLDQARVQQLLAGTGLAQSGMDQLLRGALANQATGLQAGLANQQAANQLGMFNEDARLRAAQFNATGQANNFSQMLQALQLGSGLSGGRAAQNAQLLAIMAGLQAPGMNPAAGGMFGGLSSVGNTLALLPYMGGLFNSQAARA